MSLISMLADGRYHSGSKLGLALGVSRTAVWKSLSALADYGLEVEAVKGRGYRLVRPVRLFNRDEIVAAISPGIRERLALEVLPSVDSTNSALVRLGVPDCEFSAFLAEMQTEGRGRRGREWVSPFGRNVYLSLRFELRGGPEVLAGLSLVVGLALVEVISKLSSGVVRLKWPNDLMLDDRKLAGVLVELIGEATTDWTVILGIGLNYDMDGAEASRIDQPWAAISEFSAIGRGALVSLLIEQLVVDIDLFRAGGFEMFKSRWADSDYFCGKEVEVLGGVLSGLSAGVDDQGNLLVESGGALHPVNAGEVSVRKRNT